MRHFDRRSALALSIGAALLALFVWAGFWQVGRARYKESLQLQLEWAGREPAISVPATPGDPDQLNFHRLSASGYWNAGLTVFLDNKVRDGIAGYEVVTPLRLAAASSNSIGNLPMHILVNRGWIAAPASRRVLPQVTTPEAPVEVGGIARIPTQRFIELSAQSVEGRIWENLTIARFRAWSKLPLQPVIIYQQGGADDGLMRVTPAPEASGLGADRHRGYAFMWFSLAALTIVLTAVMLFKPDSQ